MTKKITIQQLNNLMQQVAATPKTDEQDCDNADWFDEVFDWGQQVANNTGCPPATSHIFGCDQCYRVFDYIIRHKEWLNTDEGARYNREQAHWSWHDLIRRGLSLKPRTDILQAGDRDWMVIGRQSPPDSLPQM